MQNREEVQGFGGEGGGEEGDWDVFYGLIAEVFIALSFKLLLQCLVRHPPQHPLHLPHHPLSITPKHHLQQLRLELHHLNDKHLHRLPLLLIQLHNQHYGFRSDQIPIRLQFNLFKRIKQR